MKKSISQFLTFSTLFFIFSTISYAQPANLTPEKQQLYNEHLKFGQPDDITNLLFRNAYICCYNQNFRIPNWVAYHIERDYLKTPTRKGKFYTYRTDPDVDDPVSSSEYNGLFSAKQYERGHLAPYKISGGDRDGDGKYASLEDPANSDDDDELTVKQINYMSNFAPQHRYTINGSGALWFKLERWIQDTLVDVNKKDVWIYAGCIVIDQREIEGVGNNNTIAVPDMFYKIVAMETGQNQPPIVLAFLFPHFKDKTHMKENSIFKYLVPVDYIEAITGLDFFNKLSNQEQEGVESSVVLTGWQTYIN